MVFSAATNYDTAADLVRVLRVLHAARQWPPVPEWDRVTWKRKRPFRKLALAQDVIPFLN